MAITKTVRDQLLVEARHRCTVCAERCFEIHHLVEQSEGGGDEPDNLIVLCPNCHQHRTHRTGEFTRDQLRIYKARLKEQDEIEKRLLQNLDEIRAQIGSAPIGDVEVKLRTELAEAARQVSDTRSPAITSAIDDTATWLAERELLRGGARRAIEVEWDIRGQREKAAYAPVKILRVVDEAVGKAPDFPLAYYLVLELDRAPHRHWIQIFENEYETSFDTMKRRTEVRSDRIVMAVGSDDNLQQQVDWAKRLVEQANGVVQRQVYPMIDREVRNRKEAALRQHDTIKSMHAAVTKLIV